jgi:hypothetical protein
VRGTVVPGGKGTVVRVERRTNHGWIVETRTRLGSGGRYAARVSRSGVYRVTGSGFAGPDRPPEVAHPHDPPTGGCDQVAKRT